MKPKCDCPAPPSRLARHILGTLSGCQRPDGNVVDTTLQIVFKGTPFRAASILSGTTEYICEAYVSISNKP